MTELRNVEADLSRFRGRVLVASVAVLLLFLLLVSRLVVLQVVRHEELDEQAEANRTAIVPIVPNRGLILDRNGIVLASNYSAYTLEITPSRLSRPLDTVIDELTHVIDIQQRDRRRFKKLLEESKSIDSLPLRTKLSDEEVARFTVQRFRFPGVDIKARLFRNYPYGELASHAIGYIGRVNQAEKKVIEDWPEEEQANYRGTEYIGKLGVEQSYEKQLHGITGVEQVETSAGGRAVRKLASTPATPGNTVRLSIDIKLQKLVEDLYGDRRGALVAIDPKTGEVLAFVSKPTFDPNLFVDGIDQENWQALNESIDKPLLNRALRGTYPPGSTFKPYMALAALETGKRRPEQAISDPGFFWFGGHQFRDDKPGGHGTVDMYRSIVQSCDTYYYILANDMGVDLMHEQLSHFGFGEVTGIDIQGESKGLLPSTEWKRKAYRRPEQQKWYAGETISLGIGQGYNNFTPLQLATAMATISNPAGARMKPHLVKEIVDTTTKKGEPVAPQQIGQLTAKPENLAIIRKAMVGVTIEGTSAAAFRGAGYTSGGKTGTAQVVGIAQGAKYSHANTEERHRDHALYIAYAPADDPKIAIGMIVENAGFGAAAAAPIARRAFDYYLQGLYPSEEDIAAVKLGKATTPIGTPRPAAEAAWPPASSAAAGAPTMPASAGAMPQAAVQSGQLIAAAFSPVANATVGTPTAGTNVWAPRWREAPASYAPAAGAKPAARAASAPRPLRTAQVPPRPVRVPPERSAAAAATPAAPAE
ncbi:penicillin-binding protein 2 [Ramlibacter alkalitolerans]|uniref:Peptidoglycan D,D-transpeptidase MrdA n=1 Tax=Ramlibacter alkalitolerans TaxID=2039631 RepID=A0ABS1JZF9_9BURK|nr:penicillin-binding protein 2 [Ramlibacter alkalitolerans]MBL0428625.1 penicillin-binding protein 2 [Ramlibacter alkalitolerans]